MRPDFNESDEEDGAGRANMEPIPPQPFAALLQSASPATTQVLPPLRPSAGEAALSLMQRGASRPPALAAGAVSSAPRHFFLPQTQVASRQPTAQPHQDGAPSSTEPGALSSTQPASRSQPVSSGGALSVTRPSSTHPTSRSQPLASGGAPSVTRPSPNSLLRPSRPGLPASAFAVAGSAQPRPSQPPAEGARPFLPRMPPQELLESQTHPLLPSRVIPDPKETLTRLQGRSDKPPLLNDEKGLGSKTPVAGTSNSKFIFSPLYSYLTHLF